MTRFFSTSTLSLILVMGCASHKNGDAEVSGISNTPEGTYYWHRENRDNQPNIDESVKLNSDSTAEYSFWADIRVKKRGTWNLINDTIYLDIVHNQKVFVLKNNDLIEQNGTIWTKQQH